MAATQAPTTAPAAAPNPHQATVTTLAQYVKDLSFENPNAPRSLQPRDVQPHIDASFTLNTRQAAPNDFEVDIKFEARMTYGEETAFALELTYGGLFRLINVAPEMVQYVVMVECPRNIFPFLRQAVAEAVRQGGFMPFYIDPIDFQAVFQHQVAQQQAQVQQAAAEASEPRVLN